MTDIIVLHYNEREVTFDPSAKMWNLTAMHTAAGAYPNKAPAQWLRNQQTQELIDVLDQRVRYANMHNAKDQIYSESDHAKNEVVQTRRGGIGGGGSTWAHWQIAAAYAHYLDPHFYLTWNEWALAHYQQHGEPAQPTAPALAALAQQVATLTADVAALHTLHELPMPAALTTSAQQQAGPKLYCRVIQIETIVAVLRLAGQPLNRAEVFHMLRQAGMTRISATQVGVRLNRLAQVGILVKTARGLYTLPTHE